MCLALGDPAGEAAPESAQDTEEAAPGAADGPKEAASIAAEAGTSATDGAPQAAVAKGKDISMEGVLACLSASLHTRNQTGKTHCVIPSNWGRVQGIGKPGPGKGGGKTCGHCSETAPTINVHSKGPASRT